MHPTIQMILTNLQQRRLSGGGFEERPGGGYRPDATAWAVLALSAVDMRHDFIDPACRSLSQSQLADGRVPLHPEHHQACWPTPLALLAWTCARRNHQSLERALSFLLDSTGVHWAKQLNTPLAHDTSLQGWPWIEDTHSWVEPTALAVTALRSVGQRNHSRVTEAIELLLDRQLPDGGWNYGNTLVYGQQLRPMPDSTGVALRALSGMISKEEVVRSIQYLYETIPGIKSPFSLAWGLLGLSAWQHPAKEAEDLISRCMDRSSVYGGFSTTHLCLLLLAHPGMAESSIFQLRGMEIGH